MARRSFAPSIRSHETHRADHPPVRIGPRLVPRPRGVRQVRRRSVVSAPASTGNASTGNAAASLATAAAQPVGAGAPAHRARVPLSQQTVVFGLFVLIFIGFAVFLPGFFRVDNLLTLLQSVSVLGILGLGMALIVIGRGIDLSMVATLVVAPGLMLQMVSDGHPLWLAGFAALALTLAVGLFNGWLIAFAEVPSLFATLASGLLLAGLGQAAFFRLDIVQWNAGMDAVAWIARGTVFGVPRPVVVFALLTLLVSGFLRWMRLGTFVYAIGDNPQAARSAGIAIRPVILLQYLLSSLIAALAGLVMAISVSSMPVLIFNSTLIYDVILVVVLGGIGLAGGRGGALSAVVGTLLIGTLLNGMTILDVSYSAQNLIKGLILLVAIAVDSFVNPRNEQTAQQGDI
ncbi:MAG: ABC transporter permease [Comamonadaceae bacterium]|nr:MAG: ABC transporter permease [Comamonadaceae bacterium]